FAHCDLTRGEQRPEQHGSGFGRRQHRLGLDPALELLMEPFNRIGGARALPLAERQPGERKEPITGFLEAVGDRRAFEPPFADKSPSAFLDFRSRGGVDHVVVIGRDLLMQPLGGVGKQVAVLVNRAALGRHVAPERDQRLLQPLPPSTIRNSGLCSPRRTRSSRTASQASLVSPPMFLTASSTFWPSSRTPSTTRSTIEVAF